MQIETYLQENISTTGFRDIESPAFYIKITFPHALVPKCLRINLTNLKNRKLSRHQLSWPVLAHKIILPSIQIDHKVSDLLKMAGSVALMGLQ